MDYTRKKKCRRIIHVAALAGACVGGGLAQIPGSDNLILVPIEIIMVMGLGHVFDMRLRHSYRTGLIVGTTATMLGRAISEWVIGWVPVLGNFIDALTAALVIEVLGRVVAGEFYDQKLRDLGKS